MSAHRDNRAKSRPRDERSDAATPDRAAADCHERLRKLRLMLGEATGRQEELSPQSGPGSRCSPDH